MTESDRRAARGLPPEHRGNDRPAFEDEWPLEQDNGRSPMVRKQYDEARRGR